MSTVKTTAVHETPNELYDIIQGSLLTSHEADAAELHRATPLAETHAAPADRVRCSKASLMKQSSTMGDSSYLNNPRYSFLSITILYKR